MAEETATPGGQAGQAASWVSGSMSALDDVEESLAELTASTSASKMESSKRRRTKPDEAWWQEQAAALMEIHTKLEFLQKDMAKIGNRVEVLCQELLRVNRVLREGISNMNAGDDSA